ncbi:MAG TPA: FeoA family protein [Desulfobacteraceae bacterium]|nr:FeoA family protein [Desulfobacteraceae bacterium]HPJ69038.1 FeoA family protein [Desulfobacteraceae bacterium]HPQ28778.1 FeoA family protein [Desulfobacteraceae bacterium]
MVLSKVGNGKEVTVKNIDGGRGLRSKLYSMGLIPGVILKVINQNSAGPVIIAVRDSRLAIGRGMAEKIIVE